MWHQGSQAKIRSAQILDIFWRWSLHDLLTGYAFEKKKRTKKNSKVLTCSSIELSFTQMGRLWKGQIWEGNQDLGFGHVRCEMAVRHPGSILSRQWHTFSWNAGEVKAENINLGTSQMWMIFSWRERRGLRAEPWSTEGVGEPEGEAGKTERWPAAWWETDRRERSVLEAREESVSRVRVWWATSNADDRSAESRTEKLGTWRSLVTLTRVVSLVCWRQMLD